MQLCLLLFVWDWLRPDALMLVVAFLEGQYQFAGTAEIVFLTCWELDTLQSIFPNIASICSTESLLKHWWEFLLSWAPPQITFMLISAISCTAAIVSSPNWLSARKIFFLLVPSSYCLRNNDKHQERVTCATVPGQLLSQVWLSRTY